jgi:hypothetical protein
LDYAAVSVEPGTLVQDFRIWTIADAVLFYVLGPRGIGVLVPDYEKTLGSHESGPFDYRSSRR